MTRPRSGEIKDRPGFLRDESGVGMVFSLFIFVLLILIGGLSVDLTNSWRNRQLLQQTGDVAAHAGAVALANGASGSDARTAAINAVQYNMPTAIHGNLFEEEATDVVLIHYDPATNMASSTGDKNAIAVFLHRTTASGNPVKTYMLNFVSFAVPGRDYSEFYLNSASVATVSETRACSSSDGIYAHGGIDITSSNTFGAGYCMHSQTDIWMPQQNVFDSGAGLSMPDLAACGTKCTDSSNPGSTAAAFETNLILPDLEALILETKQAFTDTFGGYPDKDEFFYGKTLETSVLPALENAGFSTSGLTKGSVVSMTQGDFESLTDIPGGLVYDVSCSATGNGPNTRLTIDSSNGGDDLHDVAIITNCSFEFGSTADISGSLLLSTRVSTTATVNAASGASIGDSSGSCDVDTKSVVMALSDMNVPSDFVGSNVAFIIDGDIHLAASSSSSTLNHSGVSFHSSGEIHISANHTFDACADPPSGMMPKLLVIRHVVPLSPTN